MPNPKPLPPFFVGKKKSNDRKNEFITTKYPLLNAQLGREDTRSIWYSKAHLEGLLDEINHAKGDGLRIYFAAYEDGEYKGQTCLIMNATRKDPAGKRVDVHLEDEPDYAERLAATPPPPPLTTMAKGRGERAGVLGEEMFQNIKDFNFGSPCPPRCD